MADSPAPPPSLPPQLVNGVAVGMPAPLLLPRAPGAHDGSAPCTPTVGGGGGSLTPRASQDSATLLAQLQLIQQQQAAAAAAAAGGTELQRPSSAPASGAGSPAGPASRPVSASASGETLGSSGSPPISPTGVAGAREAAVGTPELAQQLKGPPLSPLGAAAALLQQQCADSASAAAQLAMLGGAGGAGSEALALLLQQQAAAAGLGHHVDQTSLLVALHSLSLGAQPPPPPGGLAAGGGLIRHASDVYQQTRAAAAAAAAAALTPPGHGLVSHRRSMDNSMLAQLQSLQASRSSPGLVGEDSYPMPDLALEAARLSPIAVGPGGDAAAALAALSGAGGPYTPRSPSYISAAPSLSAGLSGAPVSPLAADVTLGGGLGRILTSAPHGDLGSLNLPPTPQVWRRHAAGGALCGIVVWCSPARAMLALRAAAQRSAAHAQKCRLPGRGAAHLYVLCWASCALRGSSASTPLLGGLLTPAVLCCARCADRARCACARLVEQQAGVDRRGRASAHALHGRRRPGPDAGGRSVLSMGQHAQHGGGAGQHAASAPRLASSSVLCCRRSGAP